MRFLVFLLVLTLDAVRPIGLLSQAVTSVAAVDAKLGQAIEGDWAGVLEYRDYKESVGSLKRVDLPTWIAIRNTGKTQTWHYIYDDGPGRTVDSSETVQFDATMNTYRATAPGKPEQLLAVSGFESLKDGRGVLVMTGAGQDNDKPADMRLTLTVRSNLMELLQEMRAAGTNDVYSFRHLYRMVRSVAPVATPAH